jgi:2-dehydro-3-deoxy-D-gluconate 5-dehydrogenase
MSHLFSLKGRNALVTGASRGIGRAIAAGFAEAGANVAVLSRSTDALAELAAQIGKLGRDAVVLTCDVQDGAQISLAVSDALAELGHLDIIVNCAGDIDYAGPFLDLSFADWTRAIRVNFESVVHLCKAVGPHLVAQGHGSVINVSSVAGTGGVPFFSPYAATKAAMISLTRSLSAEWAAHGIRVNALTPGWVATELTRNLHADPAVSAGLLRQVPAGRWGEPEEMVGAAVYLACDASRYVTGTCLTVDGGMTANAGGPTMIDLLGLGRIANA